MPRSLDAAHAWEDEVRQSFSTRLSLHSRPCFCPSSHRPIGHTNIARQQMGAPLAVIELTLDPEIALRRAGTRNRAKLDARPVLMARNRGYAAELPQIHAHWFGRPDVDWITFDTSQGGTAYFTDLWSRLQDRKYWRDLWL